MNEKKELKSIKIVPYTLMNSSLSAVWGLVLAIILLIVAGTFSVMLPSDFSAFAGFLVALGVAGLVVFPVGSFLLSITQSFLYALIYNLLVPKLGGIKIELAEMKEITRADIVPFALIIGGVSAVFQFITQLVMVPLQYLIIEFAGNLASTMSSVTNSTSTIPMSSLGAFSIFGAIINIILTPIITFIMVFIGAVIVAFLYNILAPKVGGIKLEFIESAHGFFGIKNVNSISLGLITGIIGTVIGLIIGILIFIILAIMGYATAGIIILITYTIGGFILLFITYALTAVFYNFLAPKIGAIEIKLE